MANHVSRVKVFQQKLDATSVRPNFGMLYLWECDIDIKMVSVGDWFRRESRFYVFDTV